MTRSSTATRKSARRELLQESILEAASKLFIQHGFQGTSMNDIAETMGVTRTAIYYYFPNKETILRELTTGVTDMAGKQATETLEQQSDPIEALRILVSRHTRLVLTHTLQFRVVERNEQHLSPALRKKAETARRLVLDRFVTAIETGVRAGQFKEVDPKITAFAILGMCNWGAWWFNPEGAIPLDKVIDSIAALALSAVVRDEERRLRGQTVDDSVRRLREDLNLLERRLRIQLDSQK